MRKVRLYDLLYGPGKQGFMMSLVVSKAWNISIQAKWLLMSSPQHQKIIIASKIMGLSVKIMCFLVVLRNFLTAFLLVSH